MTLLVAAAVVAAVVAGLAGCARSPRPPSFESAAGSIPIGSATYAVPAGAIFVVAADGTGGSGTRTSPYESAAVAVAQAPSGSTVVLRGGTYHETLKIPAGKSLTIQPYPHEAVWFDGASTVTGWAEEGGRWVVSGWDHLFDHRVSFGVGKDESSRYVDPAYPMAGHPDAVWVDGAELTQVGSEAAVTTGTFYVDEGGRRLVVGTDPTGRTVEASTLAKAIQVQGADSTVRGIGIRRYAAHLALFGAVSYEADDVTLENVVIADNATLGVGGWGDHATLRRLTVVRNGLLGIHADKASGLRVLRSLVEYNNDQRFLQEPVSGGIKTSNTDGATFADNLIAHNNTIGLWLDVSMRHFKIVRNVVMQNSEGIEVELSGHGIIADNYIAHNAKAGLFLFDANDVQVWNNTLDTNGRSIQVLQDDRRNTLPTASLVPWRSRDIEVVDNAVSFGDATCPLLVQDTTGGMGRLGVRFEANLYRRSSVSPPELACSTETVGQIVRYRTLAAWAESTGNDTRSRWYDGTDLLDNASLSPKVRRETSGVPLGLPSDVAAAVRRPHGDRRVGSSLVLDPRR